MKNANQNPAENPVENEEKWESLDKVELEETEGGGTWWGLVYSISAECNGGKSCSPFSIAQDLIA